ncbi:AMP-binding protein [Gordonia terrae]|uniref:AMP-binding protein n=1 Tax=Gordonia terrae TaxID=2055 RepID=UPI003F6B7352
MRPPVAPPSLLDEAQRTHGLRAAVHAGDAVIDFERFAESAGWMSGELRMCGLEPGIRVGLAIRTGWEFVLAWHSLVDLGAVVVPIDLSTSTVTEVIRDLEIGFLLAHADHGTTLEDIVEAVVPADAFYPFYDVADGFTLVDLGSRAHLAPVGGLVSDHSAGSVEPIADLLREARDIVRAGRIRRGTRVPIRGTLDSRETMIVIMACAAAGACVCVDAPFGAPSWTLSAAS